MKTFYVSVVFAVALVGLSSPALAAIQLIPVVTSGITSPTFVGHAGDGSNRLLILEQAGIIDVLQPGGSTLTMFLDVRTKVKSTGEEGLLGLAFHPNYAVNGRFFIFYTRIGDGAIVIAEFKVSSINANVADPTERIVLTIPHPTNTNHNGGMLAFGPDGYLYIGVGDGGSANDPPNNAQNKNVLLGKILRIDINTPAGVPYVSPPDNPFYGPTDGLDEIFALGMRNPWRFSFDRLTGQQWVADVGQGNREEVDTPIINGGNYGWRVYESTVCTNNDPSLCSNPDNYIPPVFDYTHSSGRCSITGGYVYEGSLSTFPTGTYVYGDYCSGEIVAWDGSTQTALLDTPLSISSFGEDEQGELYVVNLSGSISRIASTTQCTYSIAPTSQDFSSDAGTGTVAVSSGSGCNWNAASNATWVHVTSGTSGTGDGSVGYSVDTNSSPSSRGGTMTIAGLTFTVNQSGAATCTYAISPTRTTFQVNGGAGAVTVTAPPSGCAWTAASNAAWITITGGASGSGDGEVTYSVAPYTGKPRNRNGTMTIAGQTFSIKQSR